ncbi:MAG: (Fe-S)-binding protein [Candidatus Methanomethylicia archaeon]
MFENLSFEIKEVMPCIKDPSRIRFVAQANMEFSRELIIVLSFKFPPGLVVYDESSGALTLKLWDRLTTIFPSGKVGVTYTLDINEAREILDRVKKLIVEAEMDFRRSGMPSQNEINARKRLTALQLYKYLPKTNCKLCGEATCMAFAVKVLNGELKLSLCKPLRGELKSRINELKEWIGDRVLKSLGWEI